MYIQGLNSLPGLGKIKGINDSKDNEVMSIQLGIYGIIEEYTAYYFGCRTALESYSFYEQNYAKKNPELWSNFIGEVESDELAFFEFQLFTAWYLDNAKQKHPDQYKKIYANKNLRIVFTIIYQNYQNLIVEVEKVKKTVAPKDEEDVHGFNFIKELDFSGSDEDLIRFIKLLGLKDVEIFTEIKNNSGNKKVLILKKDELKMFKDEYNGLKTSINKLSKDLDISKNDLGLTFTPIDESILYLKKEMSEELYKELQKFILPNLNLGNYKNFLE